jgi:uncharacterized protein (TIGR00369 family)
MANSNPASAGSLEWSDDHYCMVCGSENPTGLKLNFRLDGDELVTEWVAEKRFQGYADILHGGMISTILDETMVNLPWKRDKAPVMSAELTVRFVRPARIGEKLEFRASCPDSSKRLMLITGRCLGGDGSLVAEASAKCLRIKNPKL